MIAQEGTVLTDFVRHVSIQLQHIRDRSRVPFRNEKAVEIPEYVRNIRMNSGDGGHTGRHHLLQNKGSALGIAIRSGDAWRDKNMRAQGERNQILERKIGLMDYDIFETEIIDLPENRRFHFAVARFSGGVSHKI
ncbi:MAG: hypothetical protein WA002_13740 [Candidatus Acidiferrales bacterium]